MKKTMLIPVVAILCIFSVATYGQKQKTRKKKKSNNKPELVAAIRQGIELPGNKLAPPEIKFVLVWNDNTEPKDFYWRNTESWQKCNVNAVSDYNRKTYEYSTRELTTAVKAGDTLQLSPMSGIKGAIPDAIQDGRDNVLYYQLSNGIWKGIPVSYFEDLRPVNTPMEFK